MSDPSILTIFYDEITFSSFDGGDHCWSYEGMDVSHKYEQKEKFKVVAIVAMLETGKVFYQLHTKSTDTNIVLCFIT